jgi:hypothetical protein
MKRKEKKKTKGMEGGSDEGDDVKKHLYCGLLPPGTNVDICTAISLGTNVSPHLYQRICTGSITGTNDGYIPVQVCFSNSGSAVC